jgi:D-alanyl-D-alanine carboxypeptidase
VIKLITNCFAILSIYFFLATGSVYGEDLEMNTIYANSSSFSITINGEETVSQKSMLSFKGKNYFPLKEIVNSFSGNVIISDDQLSITASPMFNKQTLYGLDQLFINEIKLPTLTFREEVEAKAAIIVDTTNGSVMFSKNSSERLYPASTTKIMTALLALELGDLNEDVIVSSEIENIPYDSSKAHIRPGDTLTLEQLLYALMLPSGNDAAVAIAVHIAGSEKAFVELMNQKAIELGATNTQFTNPHGYHDPDQYTTAEDLAKIGYAATKLNGFTPLISTARYRATFTREDGEESIRNWKSTNQHLQPNSPLYAPEFIGGKTGFTTPARYTLVSFASKDGYDYISVILYGQPNERYIDSGKLFERAFAEREKYNIKYLDKLLISPSTLKITIGNEQLSTENSLMEYNNELYITEDVIQQIFEQINRGTLQAKASSDIGFPLIKDLQFHRARMFMPLNYLYGWFTFNKKIDLLETETVSIISR